MKQKMADLFTQTVSHPIKKAAPRNTMLGGIGLATTIEKRQFTADDRQKLADSGAAMPGGRYPIEKPVDVTNAVRDYNRTGQDPAVKAHIISRAKAIGATGNLPDDWITKYNENHGSDGKFSSGDGSGTQQIRSLSTGKLVTVSDKTPYGHPDRRSFPGKGIRAKVGMFDRRWNG
jgi:hypothetical protein